jgi:hypothetical protein
MPLSDIDKSTLQEIEETITNELRTLQKEALSIYCDQTGRDLKLQSFHATIGGKNNTYVDSVSTQFPDFEDFKAQWLRGLRFQLVRFGKVDPTLAAYRIAKLIQNPVVQKYTFLFLERNFYRNYVERTRAKPGPSLWNLWFGDKSINWGLIIAPAHRCGEWTNDKSEMRRAKYTYWTVGHVLSAGLVDPDSVTPYHFHDLENLLSFYRSILKRVSNSMYEKAIADRYVNYLENSKAPLEEPFLIPELRYAGLKVEHKHRLDFTVLNAHTMSLVGFELSPHSTHYFMDGITKKTQKQINQELAAQWEKEMVKRNDYFASYGITTLTFTDANLADMDECFNSIADRLRERPREVISVENELSLLKKAIA